MSDDWGLDVHQEVLYVSEEQDQYEARTERGYVLLARGIDDSSLWLQSDCTLRVAIFLITRANWKGGKFFCRYQRKEMIIQPGEMITSIRGLADDMNRKKKVITVSKLRTALRNLTDAKFIEDLTPEVVKLAKGYTYLKLLKYHIYQNPKTYIDTRLTHDSHTVDTRLAHIETYKQDNKVTYKESAAAKPRRASPANPDIKKFIDFWFQLFKSRLGFDPLINGEHGRQLQQILRKITLPQLEKMAEFAFEHDYPFLAEKGYALRIFLSSAMLEEIRSDMKQLGEL